MTDAHAPDAQASHDPGDAAADPRRRRFLSRVTLALMAGIGAVIMIGPIGMVLSPLLRGRRDGVAADQGGWTIVGRADRFAVGAAPSRVVLRQDQRDSWLVRRRVAIGSVLVQRTAPDAFRVFSGVCPHLGCAVGVNGDTGTFLCPCHKSAFALDGSVLAKPDGAANPAPRSLDPLEAKVDPRSGVLSVKWVRYRTGSADRTPV